jgi:aspartyl-tRNA(Asn)/glutamyl-tRNA(Gln) amidotransferase subunit C
MAVSTDDVKKLAELSRLALSEGEIEKLRTEIESIVSYIDAVQKIPLPDGVPPSPHLDIVNVMRDDVVAHDGRAHSDALTKQFPDQDGDYLRVKKILG